MSKIKTLKKIIDELPKKYLRGEVEKIRIINEHYGLTYRDIRETYRVNADDKPLFKTLSGNLRGSLMGHVKRRFLNILA